MEGAVKAKHDSHASENNTSQADIILRKVALGQVA
jgi:hypothetical protein